MSAAAAGRRERADDTWVPAIDPRMPEPAHGWKLHVKYARTPEILQALTSGFRSLGAVGTCSWPTRRRIGPSIWAMRPSAIVSF